MVQVSGNKCPRYNTVIYWLRKFKSGFILVMDGGHETCPPLVGSEDDVTIVKKLALQNKPVAIKQLSNETGSNDSP